MTANRPLVDEDGAASACQVWGKASAAALPNPPVHPTVLSSAAESHRQTSGKDPRSANGREVRILARASISSLVATGADGIAYQVLLVPFHGHYGVAALAGALLGAVTNFSLNRYWAFPRTSKGLATQALQYAVASAVAYLALRGCLFLLIELCQLHERLAWVPAKAVAWLLVSYPLHRFVVFVERATQKVSQ